VSQQHREAAGKDAREAALHCCHPTEQQNQSEHKSRFMAAELLDLNLHYRSKVWGHPDNFVSSMKTHFYLSNELKIE